MTKDDYIASGMSEDDAATAAASDAVKDAPVPVEVRQAQHDEARGVDPAEKPVDDVADLRADHRELAATTREGFLVLRDAVRDIVQHLDPAGTSHAFEVLRKELL